MDFDSDEELEMHVSRELIVAASRMNEAQLQSDLLAAVGVPRFAGVATSIATVDGNTTKLGLIDYNDLMRLEITLDNNLCPNKTKLITGTRMIDTKTVGGARLCYVGSELIPTLRNMLDNFNQPAFIPAEKYAAGTTLARGEIGMIGGFKFIVVQQMQSWLGGGATVTANPDGLRTTTTSYSGLPEEKFDVFPMLIVGSGSFSTIGFQTDGKSVKFKIKHVKPESDISYAKEAFGEKGFTSIKWYYGSIILRPEWIGCAYTCAVL